MSTPNPRSPTDPITLIPIDLHSPPEVTELLIQRRICGWRYSDTDISEWRSASDRGRKALFWITLPARAGAPRAGHISLAREASAPDYLREFGEGEVLTISTFFVMPAFRSGGVGGRAMGLVEGLADKEPYGDVRCVAVAVDTASRAYWEEEGAREVWGRMGMEAPQRGASSEDFYVRRGYVKWKEEPRYEDVVPDKGSYSWTASFLKKTLVKSEG